MVTKILVILFCVVTSLRWPLQRVSQVRLNLLSKQFTQLTSNELIKELNYVIDIDPSITDVIQKRNLCGALLYSANVSFLKRYLDISIFDALRIIRGRLLILVKYYKEADLTRKTYKICILHPPEPSIPGYGVLPSDSCILFSRQSSFQYYLEASHYRSLVKVDDDNETEEITKVAELENNATYRPLPSFEGTWSMYADKSAKHGIFEKEGDNDYFESRLKLQEFVACLELSRYYNCTVRYEYRHRYYDIHTTYSILLCEAAKIYFLVGHKEFVHENDILRHLNTRTLFQETINKEGSADFKLVTVLFVSDAVGEYAAEVLLEQGVHIMQKDKKTRFAE